MRIDEHNVAHQDFTLCTFNTDADYAATPRWFFEICQEIAGLHSLMRGCAITDLIKEGKSWVISRERMEIYSYPRWADVLHLKTGIPESSSYFAPRTIVAQDKDGKPVFKSSTMWAVVDYQTKMPLKVGDIYERIRAAVDEDFVDTGLRRTPKTDLDAADQTGVFSTYRPQVSYWDTDLNRHVNNTVYLDWILRSMNSSYLKSHRPALIDVMWMHEIHETDRVVVNVYKVDENRFVYAVCTEQENGTLTRACAAEIQFD